MRQSALHLWLFTAIISAGINSAAAQTGNCGRTEPTTPDPGRFIKNSNGTVNDKTLNVMWKQCPEGQKGERCQLGRSRYFNWVQAQRQAERTEFAGYDDWRIPTDKELRSLIEPKCQSPAINLAWFPRTPASGFWFRSPESDNSFQSSAVHFAYGTLIRHDQKNVMLLRLVRTVTNKPPAASNSPPPAPANSPPAPTNSPANPPVNSPAPAANSPVPPTPPASANSPPAPTNPPANPPVNSPAPAANSPAPATPPAPANSPPAPTNPPANPPVNSPAPAANSPAPATPPASANSPPAPTNPPANPPVNSPAPAVNSPAPATPPASANSPPAPSNPPANPPVNSPAPAANAPAPANTAAPANPPATNPPAAAGN